MPNQKERKKEERTNPEKKLKPESGNPTHKNETDAFLRDLSKFKFTYIVTLMHHLDWSLIQDIGFWYDSLHASVLIFSPMPPQV